MLGVGFGGEVSREGRMRILFVASEAFPYSKTGGLADVTGSLPGALARRGVDVTLIVPAYRTDATHAAAITGTGQVVRVPVGGEVLEGRILEARRPPGGVAVFLVERAPFFDRPGIYGEHGHDYADNPARFVFYQRAALEACRLLELEPDVVHCHDWQSGLVPTYIDEVYRRWPGSGLARAGTLMTVHNVAYQGSFEVSSLPLTGLDGRLFHWERLEAYGRLNFLKAGLAAADLISTVSPSYARELLTPEGGWGLDGLFRARSRDLRGIVNGIDRQEWDPAHDRHLVARYDSQTFASGKAACKAELRRIAGLDPSEPERPLLAYIGRLDRQKGIDLIVEMAEGLAHLDAQLVVLGTGSPEYERSLEALQARRPGRVRCFLTFSESLAHQIDGAADLLLMPSRYEPCGLSQLYGLSYGAVPVVRRTGGLADTVVDATPEALADGTATGFLFRDPDAQGLSWAIGRALRLREDRLAWSRIVRAGMRADWSWDRSAEAYLDCYEEIRSRRHRRAAG